MTRRRRVAALLACAVVVAPGCSSVQTGRGVANANAVAAADAARFEAAMQVVSDTFDDPGDQALSTYTLARYGERRVQIGEDVVRVGDPPSFTITTKTARTGENLDILHRAGDALDYVLLGDTFRSLAPTPWVSWPSYYAPEELTSVCDLPGLVQVCGIVQAIDATAVSDPDGLVQEVLDTGGTDVELRTGVSLGAVVNQDLIEFTDEMEASFTDEDLKALLPVVITASGGAVTRMEINGVLPAAGDRPEVQVQYGVEVTGTPTEADIPPLPTPFDVTAIPDRAASEAFYQQVTALRGS